MGRHFHTPASHQKQKGFTLLEMLVSISIFMIITALVIVKYQSFNGGIVLTNTAYEVALAIRQAQNYGINVHDLQSGNQDVFNVGYGIHFSNAALNSFILFGDIYDSVDGQGNPINNGIYLANDTQISQLILRRGITIKKFCGVLGTTASCNTTGAITNLDITFNRPNPDALLTTTSTNGGSPSTNYSYAIIRLVAPDGVTIRDIKVAPTGQISIPDFPDPNVP